MMLNDIKEIQISEAMFDTDNFPVITSTTLLKEAIEEMTKYNIGVACIVDKKNLSFALAKVHEDLGNYDQFFEFLNEGNKLRKNELNYSFASSKNFHSSLISAFKSPPKIIAKSKQDKSTLRPIFILGMPRSGTTLVEQIISSHNQVFGAGELNNLKNIVTPILENYINNKIKAIKTKEIESIRKDYLDSLIKLNTKETVVTDKMPINFRLIGFILTAIPEAKIIHVKRDARATCWSNYKHYFSSGNGFTFNQEDLVKFFQLYSEIMKFWHKLFPNWIDKIIRVLKVIKLGDNFYIDNFISLTNN